MSPTKWEISVDGGRTYLWRNMRIVKSWSGIIPSNEKVLKVINRVTRLENLMDEVNSRES